MQAQERCKLCDWMKIANILCHIPKFVEYSMMYVNKIIIGILLCRIIAKHKSNSHSFRTAAISYYTVHQSEERLANTAFSVSMSLCHVYTTTQWVQCTSR